MAVASWQWQTGSRSPVLSRTRPALMFYIVVPAPGGVRAAGIRVREWRFVVRPYDEPVCWPASERVASLSACQSIVVFPKKMRQQTCKRLVQGCTSIGACSYKVQLVQPEVGDPGRLRCRAPRGCRVVVASTGTWHHWHPPRCSTGPSAESCIGCREAMSRGRYR